MNCSNFKSKCEIYVDCCKTYICCYLCHDKTKHNFNYKKEINHIKCRQCNFICDKKFNKNVEFIFILDNFTMSFNWGAVNEECIIEEKLMKLYDLFE